MDYDFQHDTGLAQQFTKLGFDFSEVWPHIHSTLYNPCCTLYIDCPHPGYPGHKIRLGFEINSHRDRPEYRISFLHAFLLRPDPNTKGNYTPVAMKYYKHDFKGIPTKEETITQLIEKVRRKDARNSLHLRLSRLLTPISFAGRKGPGR